MTRLQTPRQRLYETLDAYIEQGTIREAADHLGISERTARQRLMRLYDLMGVRNGVQAAYRRCEQQMTTRSRVA